MCMGGYEWVMYMSVMSPEARRGSLTVVRGKELQE